MKKKIIYLTLGLLTFAVLFSFSMKTDSIFLSNKFYGKKPCLYCIHDADDRVALVNQKGDTLAPFGKFDYCFFESTKTFGIVYDQTKNGFFAYNVDGTELYQVMMFDNGPDYIEDGMFRIIKNGKIGYANEKGEVMIEPQFECALPFEKGRAEVSYTCETKIEGEHTLWLPDSTFYINKKGVPVK